MEQPTPQQYLPDLRPGNRSRTSSAASKYTPEGYLPSPPAQPSTEGYYPAAPTSQPSYPPDGSLLAPASSSYPPTIPPTSHPGGQLPQGSIPNPPYPTEAEDPLMRPMAHTRHASHSSARSARSHRSHRSHRSRHSGDDDDDYYRYSRDHDREDDSDGPQHHHHHHHGKDRPRRHSHRDRHHHSDRDDTRDGGGHPLRKAERAASEDSELSDGRRLPRRAGTMRPTLGDTVFAMWDGLKTVLGPRDR